MKKTYLMFLILLLTSTLGQVTADLYLPALPLIAKDLSAPINWVQWSITSFVFGFSISQLIYGPISDVTGRKKPLLFGLGLLLAGGLICWHAPTIQWMIFGRLVQGLGAGIIAVARAILRDLFSGPSLAKYGSYLAVGSVTLMASAPLVGAVIQNNFGWQAIFATLVLYTLLLIVTIRFKLPETNRHLQKDLTLNTLVQHCKTLRNHSDFRYFAMILFASYGGILGYLSVGPVLLQVKLGLTPVEFGGACILTGVANGLCGLSNARWVGHYGMRTMLRTGLTMMTLGALSLLSGGLIQPAIHFWTFMIPLMLFMGGSGFIFANVFAAAIEPFHKIAGLTASVLSFFNILGGAVSSGILAHVHEENQLPLAWVLCACAAINVYCFHQIKSRIHTVIH